jgi:hypothetical protein
MAIKHMNSKKPEPLFVEQLAGQPCPVCGKRSYSLAGIHPQCAMLQADAPRQRRLAEAKRRTRLLADLNKTDAKSVTKRKILISPNAPK